jgi:hypothetical protein
MFISSGDTGFHLPRLSGIASAYYSSLSSTISKRAIVLTSYYKSIFRKNSTPSFHSPGLKLLETISENIFFNNKGFPFLPALIHKPETRQSIKKHIKEKGHSPLREMTFFPFTFDHSG